MVSKTASILENNFCLNSVMIELTTKCNLKCVHCYVCNRNEFKHTQTFPFEKLETLIEQLKKTKTIKVYLTGGEPFCHPKINEILRVLKENNFLVYVLTNATLINQNNINIIKKYVYKILTTCYGDSKETYEAVTGIKNSYDMYSEAIKLLKENNIHYSERSVLLKENEININQLIEKCSNIETYICVDCTDCYAKDHFPSTESLKKYLLYKFGDVSKIKSKIDNYKVSPSDYVCTALAESLFIQSNGCITPCANFDFSLGNIFEEKIDQIWSQDNILKIKEGFRWKHYKKCFECKYFSYNLYMCPANNLYETGNMYNVSDNMCNMCKIVSEIINNKESKNV